MQQARASAARRRLEKFLQHQFAGPLPVAFDAWKRFTIVSRRRRWEFKFHLNDQRIFKGRQHLRKSKERIAALREQIATLSVRRDQLVNLTDEHVLIEADTLQERRVLEGILRSFALAMSYLHTLALQQSCPRTQTALLAQALLDSTQAVSYTHLTLPTIYSV